jgi:histidine triad (HIT) family protein
MSASSSADCLFCSIVAGRIPASKVYEDDNVLAFKDIHPQAPVHFLIIPKVHLATLDDFDASQRELAGSLLLTAKRLAAEHSLPGYRVALNVNEEGGQVIYHVHLHLLGGRKLQGSLG